MASCTGGGHYLLWLCESRWVSHARYLGEVVCVYVCGAHTHTLTQTEPRCLEHTHMQNLGIVDTYTCTWRVQGMQGGHARHGRLVAHGHEGTWHDEPLLHQIQGGGHDVPASQLGVSWPCGSIRESLAAQGACRAHWEACENPIYMLASGHVGRVQALPPQGLMCILFAPNLTLGT